MEKVTKKYKCSIYKGGVWWSANSIDKPSKNLFIKNYKNKMVDIDITPNWIDQFTVNLVLDKPSYGLLKIEDLTLNKTFYFINSNINKTLTNGYLVTYDLDLYLTYGLTFFEEIRKQGFNTIKVNRVLNPLLFRKYSVPTDMKNKYFPYNIIPYYVKYQYLIDPLIDYEKYSYTSYMREATIQLKVIRPLGYLHKNGYYGPDSNNTFKDTANIFNGDCPIYVGGNNYFAKPLVHMFQFPNGEYVGFVQFATDGWATLKWPNWAGEDAKKSFSNILDPSGNIKLKVVNNFAQTITDKITWLSNSYIGCFEIPFLEYIRDWYLWGGEYSTSGGMITTTKPEAWGSIGGGVGVILTFVIRREKQLPLFNISSLKTVTSNIGMFNSAVFTNNSINLTPNSTQANGFLLNYANPYGFTFRPQNGTSYYPLDFWSNSYLTFDGNNFNIIQNTTTTFNSTTPLDSLYVNMINGGNAINRLRGTLNVSTNSYNDYINSVKIQQNTNLEVARQNLELSTFTDLFKFGANGVLSGYNMVSQGLNIASGLMKYQNMEKVYAAQNQTARNTSHANNISSSVTSDDIYNKMNMIGSSPISRVYVNIPLRYPQTNIEQLEVLNFLLQYGIYINDYFPVDLFFSFLESETPWLNDFVYIDFEVTERLLKMVFPTENQELINALKILCDNSFRIWKIDDIKFSEDKNYYVF